MRQSVFLVVALVGCTGGPKVDPFDPDVDAVLPGWIDSALAGEDDACASSPLWDDPDAHIATTFFAGEYFWEGDEDFVGNEFWLIWPDNDLAATGFEPCELIWDVFGSKVESAGAADYSLILDATLDEIGTTCLEDENGNSIGDERFSVRYNVNERNDGTLQIFFESGTPLGSGEFDNNGMSWLSEKDCVIF